MGILTFDLSSVSSVLFLGPKRSTFTITLSTGREMLRSACLVPVVRKVSPKIHKAPELLRKYTKHTCIVVYFFKLDIILLSNVKKFRRFETCNYLDSSSNHNCRVAYVIGGILAGVGRADFRGQGFHRLKHCVVIMVAGLPSPYTNPNI